MRTKIIVHNGKLFADDGRDVETISESRAKDYLKNGGQLYNLDGGPPSSIVRRLRNVEPRSEEMLLNLAKERLAAFEEKEQNAILIPRAVQDAYDEVSEALSSIGEGDYSLCDSEDADSEDEMVSQLVEDVFNMKQEIGTGEGAILRAKKFIVVVEKFAKEAEKKLADAKKKAKTMKAKK